MALIRPEPVAQRDHRLAGSTYAESVDLPRREKLFDVVAIKGRADQVPCERDTRCLEWHSTVARHVVFPPLPASTADAGPTHPRTVA